MSTVPMITPDIINGMTGLEERPVYFLKVNGSPTPNLVIKGEPMKKQLQDAQKAIAWSAKLMKNVNNPLVNTKIMTPAEISVFCKSALSYFAPGTVQMERVTTERDNNIWVKMPLVTGLSDADYFTRDSKLVKMNEKVSNLYDLKQIKSGLAALLNEKVWQDLGKIVAVDVFNGNSDRFNVNTGEWANKGNIMFLQNGLGGAIGLDTWDSANFNPNSDKSSFSNLNVRGHFDALKALIDPAYRQKFATKCLTSVGKSFKTAMTKAGMFSATFHLVGVGSATIHIDATQLDNFFTKAFLMDFIQGMQQGSDELKRYLQGKVRQYQGAANPPKAFAFGQHRPPARPTGQAPARPTTNAPMNSLPAGVMSRMQYLGW